MHHLLDLFKLKIKHTGAYQAYVKKLIKPVLCEFSGHWLTCLLRSSIIRVIWIFFLPIFPVFSFLTVTNELDSFVPLYLSRVSSNQTFFYWLPPLNSKIPVAVPVKSRERGIKSDEIQQNRGVKNRERQSLSHMGQQIKTKESVDIPKQRCFLPSISCKSDCRALAATASADSTVMLPLPSPRIWQCFGSATNLTALITCSVTFTAAWTTSSGTFLKNTGVTSHWIVTNVFLENVNWASRLVSPFAMNVRVHWSGGTADEVRWQVAPVDEASYITWFIYKDNPNPGHPDLPLVKQAYRALWGRDVCEAFIGPTCRDLFAFERLPSPEKLTQAFYKVLVAQIRTVWELAITEHTCVYVCVCVHVHTSLLP